ncbi:hypothetical protein [Neobacillus drentensis]|uniref:hypothetical protein n=1 Tax=Neobacillus drentensis TaxID=220684 RepID=UPI0030001C40
MRLFKVYDPGYIEEYSQCLGIWAESEQQALRKMATIQVELDLYDDPYETVMNEFKVEEYYPAHDCDVYMCYEKDMDFAYDVQVIFVPHMVSNVESYLFDQLADYNSKLVHFIDYVNDTAINMSLAEMFYQDENGYVFDFHLDDDDELLQVRDDIKEKAKAVGKSVDSYIDSLFFENVNKFFADNNGYRNEYLSYIYANDEPFFEDEFYFYVSKKLMKMGQWTEYDIHLVDIIAE